MCWHLRPQKGPYSGATGLEQETEAEKVSANTRLSQPAKPLPFFCGRKRLSPCFHPQQHFLMFLVRLWNQEPEVFPSCTEGLGWCLCSGEVGKEDWFYMELPSCWGDSLQQATFAGSIAQSAAHSTCESSATQLTPCPHRSYTSGIFMWMESQKTLGPEDGFLTFSVVVNFWKFRLFFIYSDIFLSVSELLILNSLCCCWRKWASAGVLLDRLILDIFIHLRGRTLPTPVSFFCLWKQSGLSTEMYTPSRWPCS